ncbi:MAG: hypothetical protein SCARUB_03284 [Candidatus Scalindua rubra]|uniref:Uncharacterized protein n=1 Tax=Candidatus Scalindua rubra TaxID=1872076 RepID=A0A1E3X7J1_9BACT|nr:MAG: hypothetical protein SCARUB_03284 [Candidatus Scalindua rubra]
MSSSVLSEIENKINQLSREEQLCLIEQLAHSLRESTLKDQSILENQLVAMASDPEIQSELKKIDEEFALTESDGLEKV